MMSMEDTRKASSARPQAYPLRLPDELRDRLNKLAEAEHRSLHSLIMHVLTRFVDHAEKFQEAVRQSPAPDYDRIVAGADRVEDWPGPQPREGKS